MIVMQSMQVSNALVRHFMHVIKVMQIMQVIQVMHVIKFVQFVAGKMGKLICEELCSLNIREPFFCVVDR